MTTGRRTTVRYSDCFKRSIVEEIEKNGLSIEDCRRKYGIGGSSTIQKWLKKYGKNHLLNKMVRVETLDEVQKIKALETELKNVKEAFANLSLRNLVLETYLEEFGKETGRTDEIKKKYAQELSKYFPNKKR
ncbi:transposase [Capnocytophaga sputigena]|jgi:hypothetical protein|uniref:transposase n=2 Tax=Capnocytophaga sputigena TaxID=1019 RepID=UPI0028D6A08B|nr:transposase [Capnocytophaga sputigena]